MALVPCGQVTVLVGTFYVESEDKSYLFSIEEEDQPKLSADLAPSVGVGPSDEIDDSEGLGRATALRWDEARGWIWIAGRFGLQAWRPNFRS